MDELLKYIENKLKFINQQCKDEYMSIGVYTHLRDELLYIKQFVKRLSKGGQK